MPHSATLATRLGAELKARILPQRGDAALAPHKSSCFCLEQGGENRWSSLSLSLTPSLSSFPSPSSSWPHFYVLSVYQRNFTYIFTYLFIYYIFLLTLLYFVFSLFICLSLYLISLQSYRSTLGTSIVQFECTLALFFLSLFLLFSFPPWIKTSHIFPWFSRPGIWLTPQDILRKVTQDCELNV